MLRDSTAKRLAENDGLRRAFRLHTPRYVLVYCVGDDERCKCCESIGEAWDFALPIETTCVRVLRVVGAVA